MLRAATLAAALVIGLAPAGRAGEAQDRLFAVGVLDGVATGQRLVFAHERAGGFDAARLPAIEGGEIEVALVAGERGREAQVTLADRPLPPLPAGAGHPLLLVFLETTARNVAAITGGSPFYIRNRMREALAAQDRTEPVTIGVDGAEIAGERLVFRPFDADPNRAPLGAFADLEIRVTVGDGVPGRFARFEAVSGPGPDGRPFFAETMAFDRMEEG